MNYPFGPVFALTIRLACLLAWRSRPWPRRPHRLHRHAELRHQSLRRLSEWITAGTAASATLDCDATSDLDPFLIVYGPTGSIVDFNDDGGVSLCDAYGSAVAFTAATSGFYTFRASSWDYARGGY